MSERLGPELDLDATVYAGMPSLSAYQCPVCQGIAYNPVCPYCAEADDEDAEPS